MRLGSRWFDFDHEVAVMAIVNRTPDSFYDRGRTFALGAAVEHALAQVEEGADIVDVGGVKAGPGAEVTVAEEIDRIVPFVTAFRTHSDLPLSVDTFRRDVAAAALDAGADLINDVSGLREPGVATVVAERPGTGLVVMHAGGRTRTRPFRPSYEPDCTSDVVRTCALLAEEARGLGVDADRIVVDPGHDFGKNTFHSLEVTRRLTELAALGYPVLVALSRKDFIGECLDGLPPSERLEGSLSAAALSVAQGARIVRAHDTLATVRAVRVAEAIVGLRQPRTALRGLE